MLTPIIGLIILSGVMFVALGERPETELSFFDPHAAIVVFGGVIGALFLAIDRRSLWQMAISARNILPAKNSFAQKIKDVVHGLESMREAWRGGRRTEILELAENAKMPELKVAADALLMQLPKAALSEKFMELRNETNRDYAPVIEGWELVGKLAPSFGMVGTVTGMVQMFQNMSGSVGNIGGTMALALLATLYGISLGAAVGGPMASRINNQLNEKLDLLEFLESTVAALIEENVSTAKGN